MLDDTSTSTAPQDETASDLGRTKLLVQQGSVSWRRGMIRPQLAHVEETQDGQPRTLTVPTGHVIVAICQTWLTGDTLDPHTLHGAGHIQRCPACSQLAREATASPRNQT